MAEHILGKIFNEYRENDHRDQGNISCSHPASLVRFPFGLRTQTSFINLMAG